AYRLRAGSDGLSMISQTGLAEETHIEVLRFVGGQSMSLPIVWSCVSCRCASSRPSLKGFLRGLVILGLLFGVAGQARSQFIYWGEANDPGHIWRANLDGSGQQPLLSGLRLVGKIALDVAGGQMYWAESDAGEIRRANLDGSGQETLLSGLP